MRKANSFFISALIILSFFSSFKKKEFAKNSFLCCKPYTVENNTSDYIITLSSIIVHMPGQISPYDWRDFTISNPIPASNFYSTNTNEFCTAGYIDYVSFALESDNAFIGIIDLYIDNVLVRSVTDFSSRTIHRISYNSAPYYCQDVRVVLRQL